MNPHFKTATPRGAYEQVIAYALGGLILAALIGSLWPYLLGALALLGAGYLCQQFNRPTAHH